jgi:hypothetical protein
MVSTAELPTAVNLSFIDQSRYFLFKVAPIYPHDAQLPPHQTHHYLENLVSTGIEPRTSESVVRNSDYWTTEAVQIFFSNDSGMYNNQEQLL